MSIGYYRAMSPAPARTSRDAILSAARAILEEDGLDAVTWPGRRPRRRPRAVALQARPEPRRAHPRGRRGRDRATWSRPRDSRSRPATRRPTSPRRIAYRAFVHANPNGYGLLFANLSPELQPDPAAFADLAGRSSRPWPRLVGADASPRRRRAPSRPGRMGSSAWSSPARSGWAGISTRPTTPGSRRSSRGSAQRATPAAG